MLALRPPTDRSVRGDAPHRVADRVRGHEHSAGQRGADHAGTDRDAGGGRGPVAQARPRSAGAHPLRALDRRRAARRSRPLLRLRLADRSADRLEPRGQRAPGADGDGARRGDRARGGRLRRGSARPGGRRDRDGREPDRHRGAELLAGDPARDRLRRDAEARSGRRISGLARAGAGARRADPSGDRARRRAGGDPDPRHPVGAHRGA